MGNSEQQGFAEDMASRLRSNYPHRGGDKTRKPPLTNQQGLYV
jgi:hypothetical protein